MKKEFNNKNIIITGASSGLGRKISINLDRLGANLVLVGRNQKSLNKTKSLMNNKHNYILSDLSNLNDLKRKIKKSSKKRNMMV